MTITHVHDVSQLIGLTELRLNTVACNCTMICNRFDVSRSQHFAAAAVPRVRADNPTRTASLPAKHSTEAIAKFIRTADIAVAEHSAEPIVALGWGAGGEYRLGTGFDHNR